MSFSDRLLGGGETLPTTASGNIDMSGRPRAGESSGRVYNSLHEIPEYRSYLGELESQHRLPKGLLPAIMRAESGGRIDAVSPVGARGPFQFMPGTAKEYGIDPLDPLQSADGAARYLKKSLDQFGNLPEAVASYNAGPGRISKTGVKGAPRETRNYVEKVLSGLMDFVIPGAEAAEMEAASEPVPEGRNFRSLDRFQSIPEGVSSDASAPSAPSGGSFSDRLLGGGTSGPAASDAEEQTPPAPAPAAGSSFSDRILGGTGTPPPPQAPPQSGKFTLVDQAPAPEGAPATGPTFTQRTVEVPGPATPTAPAPQGAKTISQMGRAYHYDPQRAASSSLIAKASFADDVKFRIPLYAKARGISPDSYQVIDGRPAYRAKDDGNWYFEEPPDGWLDPINSFGELADRTAGNAGPAIPALAGTAAGIATFPAALTGVGIAGTVGATAGAQAGGELVRQAVGKALTGEDVDLGKVAEEGAYGAVGQAVPTVAIRAARPFIERVPTVLKNIPRTERARIDTAAAADLARKAKEKKIGLTPAELADSPSMKAEQKYLSNMPQSADKMGDYYQGRATQIDEAVNRELTAISPNDSTELAGRDAIGAAKGAIKGARAARTAEARPKYEAVVNERSVLDEGQFGPVAGDPYLMERVAAVKSSKLHGMQELPDQSLPVLDQVKKDLDDAIDVARRGGEGNKARLLSEKRAKLLEATDTAFPDYPGARAAFAGESPAVDELEQGVIGQIAKLKDTSARDAADRLMSGSRIGPLEAGRARNAIEKESPEAWQGVKRAWLSSQWDRASKENLTDGALNAGPKFRKALMGDPQQRKVLETVLSQGEMKSLSDLSEVLEAAGRVKPIGSDTAWNAEMQRLAGERATPWIAKAADTILSPHDWGKNTKEALTRWNLSRQANKLVDVITSPDAAAELARLRQMSPGTARWAVGVTRILEEAGLFEPLRKESRR